MVAAADQQELSARVGRRAAASARSRRRGPPEIIEWLVEDGDPVSEGQPAGPCATEDRVVPGNREGACLSEPSFTAFPPAAGARILSLGGYQPANVVTNDDLAARVDTNDEWIRSRVGIVSRRFAGPDETVTDMAVAAGGKALAAAACPRRHRPGDRGHLQHRGADPNASAAVAHRLGIVAPGAYDLNAACAGLLLRAGQRRGRGPGRHGTARAGDRGGEDERRGSTRRPVHLHHLRRRSRRRGGRPGRRTASRPASARWSGAAPATCRRTSSSRTATPTSTRKGQAVFRWATTAMHPIAAQACERAGVAVSDLAAFVPHQANLRIIEAIARKLGVPRERRGRRHRARRATRPRRRSRWRCRG